MGIRIVTTIAIVIACLSSCVNSFNVPGNIMTQTSFISSSSLMMGAEEDDKEVGAFERGVSIDQDGKSNVWAIEPKVEVDAKSSQEKNDNYLSWSWRISSLWCNCRVCFDKSP